MIKYSIIIPHKNIPDLLIRCINSIPIREDIQVIVVDDKSDGADNYICQFEELSNPNLELYLTKEGKGAGYARNVGMQHAKGEWVLFSDADDFFVDDWIEIIDKYSDSNADVVAFQIECRLSDDLSVIIDSSWYNAGLNRSIKGEVSSHDVLFSKNFPWAKMVKRSFLINHSIMFEEISHANDVSWGYHVAAEHQECIVAPEVIYCLSRRNGSLTTQKNIDILWTRYYAHKRASLYALSKGFDEYGKPEVVNYLSIFRSFGIKQYMNFILRERKELWRAKKMIVNNKPNNYKYPFLYALFLLIFKSNKKKWVI